MTKTFQVLDADKGRIAFRGLSEREACIRAETLNGACGRTRYRVQQRGHNVGLD